MAVNSGPANIPPPQTKFRCGLAGCNKVFSRIWNLNRHIQRKHQNSNFSEKCILCNAIFFEADKLQEHLLMHHRPSNQFYIRESAFRNSIMTYRYDFDLPDEQTNFNKGQAEMLKAIKEIIRFEAAKSSIVKVSLIYICEMSMIDYDGQKLQTALIPFRSTSFLQMPRKAQV